MSKPRPPDFSRGWIGAKWYDPDMTPEERADVEAIVAGVGVYVPRPPPIEPKAGPAAPAAPEETRPEPKPKPAPPAKRGGKKRRDDDGPMLF